MNEEKKEEKKEQKFKKFLQQAKEYNLKTAMLALQSEQLSAEKDGENSFFQNSKYATIESIIKTLEPASQFGIFWHHTLRHKDGLTYVTCTVSHVNDDATIVSEIPIRLPENSLNDPQKIGGAITYFKRYTLQSVFGIPSEDDDGNSNSKVKVTEAEIKNLKKILDGKNYNHQRFLQNYKLREFKDLLKYDYDNVIKRFKGGA